MGWAIHIAPALSPRNSMSFAVLVTRRPRSRAESGKALLHITDISKIGDIDHVRAIGVSVTVCGGGAGTLKTLQSP